MISVQKLAIYLPHNLEFIGGGDRWKMYSVSVEGAVLLKNGLHDTIIHEANVGLEYKPILKPMSHFDEQEQNRCGCECSGPTNGEPYPQITLYARQIDWLCRNQFDVFRLVDSGFAVDYYSVS